MAISVNGYSTNASEISFLHQLKGSSKKTNLFVGRTPSEGIPDSTESLKWVSLDIMTTNTLDPNRIHLAMDCNNSDQMKKIQGLFNTLVIDLSTTKFFDKDTLNHFVFLVEQGGDFFLPSEYHYINVSEEIEDFETNYFTLRVGPKKNRDYQALRDQCVRELLLNRVTLKADEDRNSLKNSLQGMNESEMGNTFKEVIQSMDEYTAWEAKELLSDPHALDGMPVNYKIAYFFSEHIDKSGILPPLYEEEKGAARELTKNRLLEFFEEVQICRQSYPFPNRYDDEGKLITYYFHAIGRK